MYLIVPLNGRSGWEFRVHDICTRFRCKHAEWSLFVYMVCSVFVEGSLLNFFVLLICYISLFTIFELICL